jgi:coenzyme F420-0:L-glutamate ligase/coenzyme F420-1:gamma-L-glutamate ligase
MAEAVDGRRALSLVALPGFPVVAPGDDIAALIRDASTACGVGIEDGDVFVVAQKIVSKAENRFVDLAEVIPSKRALLLAAEVDKDPRLVELILSESARVLRYRKGVLIVVHRIGVVLANAGIDRSNVGPGESGERVLLLPRDPDASCVGLRDALFRTSGRRVGVVINDSLGRAWRNGTVGVAIGTAGLPALMDMRGRNDLFGRPLEVTQVALADEVSAAASLLQGQADEGTPVVLVRGLSFAHRQSSTRELIRDETEDLFR